MAERIEMELAFRGESAEETKSLLAEAGAGSVETRPAMGLTGIEEFFFFSMVFEGMAKLITSLVRLWKCGVVVVVEADGKKISTEKNCDIPRGSVLLVHPDGTQVTLQEPTEPQVGSWFKDAFKALSGKG